MHIVQIVLPGASEYERKCQRVDLEALSGSHKMTIGNLHETQKIEADVAHVYGPLELPSGDFVRFRLPYVASGSVQAKKWSWRKPVAPAFVISPLGERPVPEAVESHYFNIPRNPHETLTIGTFRRPSVMNAVEQTMARIQRFRTDIEWNLFERVPTPEDLAGVDLWCDPAIDENDFDGFVAEALVAGLPVVASRTPLNAVRLEKGRTGFLVPRNDPNEATHAILSVLFKPEVAQQKMQAARQTVSKFQARHRVRVLAAMYETLIR